MAAAPRSSHDRDIGTLLERTAMLVDNDAKADAARRDMHLRQNNIEERLARIEEGQAKTNETVSDMKKVTEDVKRWRLMGIGALGVVGIGGVSVGALIAGSLERIAALLKG